MACTPWRCGTLNYGLVVERVCEPKSSCEFHSRLTILMIYWWLLGSNVQQLLEGQKIRGLNDNFQKKQIVKDSKASHSRQSSRLTSVIGHLICKCHCFKIICVSKSLGETSRNETRPFPISLAFHTFHKVCPNKQSKDGAERSDHWARCAERKRAACKRRCLRPQWHVDLRFVSTIQQWHLSVVLSSACWPACRPACHASLFLPSFAH